MANKIDQSSRFSGIKSKLTGFGNLIFSKSKGILHQTSLFIQRHPFYALFSALLLLVVLMVLGNTVFKTKPVEEKPVNQVKQVHVFALGAAPKVTVQAKAEKSGVIQIVAQGGGIVNSINVSEGGKVNKGQILVNLATNYQGGNAASLSRQIAQNQNDLAQKTYDDQKQTIEKNREAAQKTDENSDQLRNIQNSSLDESHQLLDLNESIVSTLNSNLQSFEATNSAGVNDATILQTQSAISQTQAAINQLRSAIRSSEFQSASDRPPAELSDLQREITLKQLDIQEKSLEVNKQISQIQYQLALVNEAAMYPAAPFGATVERVFVRVGQSVTPGTVLASLTAVDDHSIKLDALVSEGTAKNISITEDSQILINGKIISMHPTFVSSEATSGQLYSIIFVLDNTYSNLFTEGSYVSVSIPVGSPDSSGVVPFVPIDSVFQTQDESYIFVVENNHAKVRRVALGPVQGKYVEIDQGLNQNDQIIQERNVVEGDQVQISP